jgi:hypothetical protein
MGEILHFLCPCAFSDEMVGYVSLVEKKTVLAASRQYTWNHSKIPRTGGITHVVEPKKP